MRRVALEAMLLIGCGTAWSSSWAAVEGQILTEGSVLISSADGEPVGQVPLGAPVWVEESRGGWVRVKTAHGEQGWMRADEVRLPPAPGQSVRSAELQLGESQPQRSEARVSTQRPWIFAARFVGIAGGRELPRRFGVGGELEASFALPLARVGFGRHRISLGASYLGMASDRAILASGVYRLFSFGPLEPEARLRIGRELSEGKTAIGLNVGARAPLGSDSERAHVAAFVEGGSLVSLASSKPLRYWGGLGLGVHF